MPAARIEMASGSDTKHSRDAAPAAGCVGYVDSTEALHSLAEVVRRAAAATGADQVDG